MTFHRDKESEGRLACNCLTQNISSCCAPSLGTKKLNWVFSPSRVSLGVSATQIVSSLYEILAPLLLTLQDQVAIRTGSPVGRQGMRRQERTEDRIDGLGKHERDSSKSGKNNVRRRLRHRIAIFQISEDSMPSGKRRQHPAAPEESRACVHVSGRRSRLRRAI